MSSTEVVPFEPSQIGQLIETIWTVVLDCSIQPASVPDFAPGTPDNLTGMISIAGAWEGLVAIHCPEAVARHAASVMFELQPDSVTSDQLEDALCELTNIVGGNFKALLPPGSYLGLPSVAKTENEVQHLAGDHVLTRLAFETAGLVFVVSIFGDGTLAKMSHNG